MTTLVGPSPTSTLPLSISDPYLLALDIPKCDTPQGNSVDPFHGSQHSFVSLILREMVHGDKKPSISTDTAIRPPEKRSRFYQLIVLGNNLDVFEYLLVDNAELPLHMPNTRSLVTGSRSSAKIAAECFIIPDASGDGDNPSHRVLESTQSKPRPYRSHSKTFEKAPDSHQDLWTLNMAWLQHLLQQVRGNGGADFSEVLDTLRKRTNVLGSDSIVASKSLFELLDSELIIGDVDVASDSLKEMLRSLTLESTGQKPNKIVANRTIISHALTKSLGRSLGMGGDTDLSQTYDHIVRFWVSPLPRHAPGRVRLLTEQLARMIAAQLCLASYRVISRTPNTNSLDKDQEHSLHNQHILPLQREPSAIYMSQEGGEFAQAKADTVKDVANSPDPALPTPESPPSLHSRGSNSSTTALESLASQRIRSRVPHMGSQIYPDTTISRITSHWDEGLDPGLYDWEESELTTATLHGLTEVDKSSQRRRERRAEKQRKRIHEPQIGPSFEPALRNAEGSQPKESFVSQQSTQATEPMVMTQVEPQSHDSPKKLTKGLGSKRRAGF